MAVPYPIEPMLAIPGEIPSDPGAYALEVKWDGIRALAYVDGGVRVTGRHGADFTSRYPEISAAMAPLAGRRAVVDGEVVAFDPEGRPSFARLQRRMHVTDPAAAHLLGRLPVSYLPFDLLHLDGRTLLDLPYLDRRALLDSLGLGAPPYLPCEPAVLEATRLQGLEGVVAKRLDSPIGRGAGRSGGSRSRTCAPPRWSSAAGARARAAGRAASVRSCSACTPGRPLPGSSSSATWAPGSPTRCSATSSA